MRLPDHGNRSAVELAQAHVIASAKSPDLAFPALPPARSAGTRAGRSAAARAGRSPHHDDATPPSEGRNCLLVGARGTNEVG